MDSAHPEVKRVACCPACDCGSGRTIVELGPESRAAFDEFDSRKYGGFLQQIAAVAPVRVRECAACGHCWYEHQPGDSWLMRMYAVARPMKAARGDDGPTNYQVSEMRQLFKLAGGSGSPTLLDFGAGSGRWSLAAVIAGFRVVAYEPSIERSAPNAAPFEVAHSLGELEGRQFSAILLEQVLEHVRNPVAVLRDVGRVCAPDTIVRVTVPNLWRAEEGRDLWRTWPFDGKSPHTMAPFEHLHGFTTRSLDEALRSAGFSPVGRARLARVHPDDVIREMCGSMIRRLSSTRRFVVAREPGRVAALGGQGK